MRAGQQPLGALDAAVVALFRAQAGDEVVGVVDLVVHVHPEERVRVADGLHQPRGLHALGRQGPGGHHLRQRLHKNITADRGTGALGLPVSHLLVCALLDRLRHCVPHTSPCHCTAQGPACGSSVAALSLCFVEYCPGGWGRVHLQP